MFPLSGLRRRLVSPRCQHAMSRHFLRRLSTGPRVVAKHPLTALPQHNHMDIGLLQQIRGFLKFTALSIASMWRIERNDFLRGAMQALKRVNEVLGEEDLDSLEKLVGENLFKSLSESVKHNVEASPLRPIGHVSDVHCFVSDVHFFQVKASERTQMVVDVDVVFFHSFETRYADRNTNAAEEDLAADDAGMQRRLFRFSSAVLDSADSSMELEWKITAIL